MLRPDVYNVYSKALEDLNSVVNAIDSGAISPTNPDDPDAASHTRQPQHSQQSGYRVKKNGGPGKSASMTSSVDRGAKSSRGRMAQGSGSRSKVKVAKSSGGNPDQRRVDCPEHKHHTMNNLSGPPACRGCRHKNMSQVRSHLVRVGHRDYRFVRQCLRCKTDFVDLEAYDLHKAQNTCQNNTQKRMDIVTPWARLYLAQYPTATAVPIPCKYTLANAARGFADC